MNRRWIGAMVFFLVSGYRCKIGPRLVRGGDVLGAFYCMFQTDSVPLCWVGIVLMGFCGGFGGGGLRPLAPSIMHQSAFVGHLL